MNSLKQSGLWSVILQTQLLFNLSYGPFEGSGWFRKLQESGQHFWQRADTNDPLFNAAYPAICRDRGEVPVGFQAHMESLMDALQNCDLLAQKGPHCLFKRWFSWVPAAQWHDRWWNTKALLMLFHSP